MLMSGRQILGLRVVDCERVHPTRSRPRRPCWDRKWATPTSVDAAVVSPLPGLCVRRWCSPWRQTGPAPHAPANVLVIYAPPFPSPRAGCRFRRGQGPSPVRRAVTIKKKSNRPSQARVCWCTAIHSVTAAIHAVFQPACRSFKDRRMPAGEQRVIWRTAPPDECLQQQVPGVCLSLTCSAAGAEFSSSSVMADPPW